MFLDEPSETSFESLALENEKKKVFSFCTFLVFSSLDARVACFLQELCDKESRSYSVSEEQNEKYAFFFCSSLFFS
jgi:hypothetical protein